MKYLKGKIKKIILFLIFFSTGTIWLRLTIVRLHYELNQEEKALEQALLEQERLQNRWIHLRSPQQLHQLAEKFSLEEPQLNRFIEL